jgi:hypothetical protein
MGAAAAVAFDGAGGTRMAGAVDDPQAVLGSIRDAEIRSLARLRTVAFHGFGGPADDRSAEPGVVFLSATEAQVEWVWLSGVRPVPGPYQPNGPDGPMGVALRFRLTPAGWKVTRRDFCAAMTLALSCPTTP